MELPGNAAGAMLDLRRFAAMVWEKTSGFFGYSRRLVEWIRMDRPFMRLATDRVRHLEMLMKCVLVIVARLQRSHWAQPETRKVSCAMAPLKRDERAWRAGAPKPRNRCSCARPALGAAGGA